ncbi:MAG: B12-binding domain-containing protein [Gemmobacter sp.]
MQDQHFGFDAGVAALADNAPSASRSRAAFGDSTVIDFASWVVALLAARKSAEDMILRDDILAGLIAAASAERSGALTEFMADLVRRKVPPAAVSDLYIPAAAMRLGEDWMEDRVSFADVTLATSRLQSMLRAMAVARVADTAAAEAGAPCVLLCVMPGEQHTLGALVLMGQLRRSGVSVRLSLGLDRAELAAWFATIRFDGVLVSASGSSPVARLAEFVRTLRDLGHPGMPIVLGGGLLVHQRDIASATGVDAVAEDIGQALAACRIPNRNDGRARLQA